MSNTSMTQAEFGRLLDVYGSERTRWPAELRAAAAQLVARDTEARRLLAEAEALDRVLERAPVPALAVEAALADRIVAAAQRSPRIVKLPGTHPGAPSAAAGAAPSQGPSAPAPLIGKWLRRPHLFSHQAGAVGLLAASLVFGVLIGNSSLTAQFLPALSDLASISLDHDELVQIALSDEVMQ